MRKKRILFIILFMIFLCGCKEKNKMVNVSFDSNGGSLVESQQVEKGSNVIKPEDPVREGYKFEGWFINGRLIDLNSYLVNDNLTFIANWKPNELVVEHVNINFDSNGGSPVESQQVEKGSNIIKPIDPVREYYTFDGWYVGDEKWNFAGFVATKDVTLIAKWIINQYTITLKYNDEITPDLVLKQDYDSDIMPINNPERVGYTFDKWSETIPSKMPAKDLTINASWNINQYTLIIKYNDYITPDIVIKQDYNSDIQPISNPERLGYTFVKWSKTIPDKMPAYSLEIDAEYICDVKYSIQNDEVTIIGPNTTRNDLVILNQYDGYNVVSIKYSAFSNCSALTSVIIQSGVIDIGNHAFYCCSNLTSVIIQDGLKSIGKHAFWLCSNLKSIIIPDSVTNIEMPIFPKCSQLSKITLPLRETDSDFYLRRLFGNSSDDVPMTLKEIVINGGNCIPRKAFSQCISLTSITISDTVKKIDRTAFDGCTNLTNIIIDSNHTIYDSRDNCNAIIETATNTLVVGFKNTIIPDSVTSIGDYAFCNCSSLTNITIPDSVTSIGWHAFGGCSSLTSIVIPDSVTSIENYAFEYCSGLTSITIPDSVTSIGWYVFSGCSSLSSITIPDSVTIINPYAFSGCSSLTSITIPDSVTIINPYAFSGCSSLTSIIIPTSVTNIGEYAFYGCSSLTIYFEERSAGDIKLHLRWNILSEVNNVTQYVPVVYGYKG